MTHLKSLLTGVVVSLIGCAHAQDNAGWQPDIIPIPVEYKRLDSSKSYKLTKDGTIFHKEGLAEQARLLAEQIKMITGMAPAVKPLNAAAKPDKGSRIILNTSDKIKTKDAYHLRITADGVRISGNNPAGLFYGAQSLVQMIDLDTKALPLCEIRDYPRFEYRGTMLDSARHFQSAEFVKKFINVLSLYKINRFHWSLTNDQGWRIEIKKYPKLTEIGSKRAGTTGYLHRKIHGKGYGVGPHDGVPYGGFYTQEEIREIVAYAKARHITIIPEFNFPGHSAAIIAAYPELGNTDIPHYKKPEVSPYFGVHTFSLAPKPETFEFIENVLEEIIALFPSEYIHTGGDEVRKVEWKKSPYAQKYMQKHGLKTERDLQAVFTKFGAEVLKKHGRKMIGWDEILHDELPPKTTIMAWSRHARENAVEAAKRDLPVIIALNGYTYLDYYQFPGKKELAKGPQYENIFGYTPLKKIYKFDPILKGMKGTPASDNVIGTSAYVWTEYIRSEKKLEYMAFPRVCALAEVAWSPVEKRNLKQFEKRLKHHLRILDLYDVNYAPKPFPLKTAVAPKKKDKAQETK